MRGFIIWSLNHCRILYFFETIYLESLVLQILYLAYSLKVETWKIIDAY